MPFEGYKTGTECKTTGSWNLHQIFPDLDFFILFSSGSGLVGLRGQTNYNAGNAYQDALARYRVSRGGKATCIDLGAMVEDGVLAENPELLKRLLGYGTLDPVTRKQFLAMLDYFCDPARALATPPESQVIIGLATRRAHGLEAADLSHPMFLQMLDQETGPEEEESEDDKTNYIERLALSASLVDAGNIIAEAMVKMLSKSVSAMDGIEVDLHKPLHTYGVDSILGMEIQKWITKQFKAEVGVFEILGGSTILAVATLIAGRSGIAHPAWHL